MATTYTNDIIFRFNKNGNQIGVTVGTLNAGGKNQGRLLVQVPFDDSSHTAKTTFVFPKGATTTSVTKNNNSVSQIQDDDGTIWYQWVWDIDDTITAAGANNTTVGIKFTSIFVNSIADQTFPCDQQSIPITAGEVGDATPIPPDEGASLATNKRDRNPNDLDDANLDSTQLVTVYDSTLGAEKQTTVDKIIELAAGLAPQDLLPTQADSTRDDIVLGGKFKKNVATIGDDDYPIPEEEITISTTVAGSFENVYSFIAYDGFLSKERFNTRFTTTLEAKKKAGNIGAVDFKLQYLKLESDNNETVIFDGLPITINTDDYNTSTKNGRISISNIDYDAGEVWITRLFLKSSSVGDGVTFKVGGINPTSFTEFLIQSSSVNDNKMDILVTPTGDKLVKSRIDGQVQETDIDIDDVEKISNRGVANGTASLDATARIPVEQMPLTAVNSLGTFGSAGSTTGGDLPSTATQGDQYTCDTDDYTSVEAGITFKLNDKAQYDLSGTWKQIASNDSVTSVNGETGDVTVDKTSVGLGNVDNTSDLAKPVSGPTQTALDDKLTTVPVLKDGALVLNAKKINYTGGLNMAVDPIDPTQVNVEIVGESGLTGGESQVGETTGSGLPLTILNAVETQIPLTLARQAVDTDVMEVDEVNNRIILKQIKNTDDEPLLYRIFIQPTVINTNAGSEVDVDFIAKRDGIEIERRTRTAAESPVGGDAALNPPVEFFVITDPLGSSPQYVTFFVEGDAIGSSLTRFEQSIVTEFTFSQNILGIMFQNVYDTLSLSKVDKTQLAEKSELHQLLATSSAIFSKNLTGVRVLNNLFWIECNGAIVPGNNAQFSFDAEATLIPVYDRDATTQLTGADVQNRKALYLYDDSVSARFVLVSNDLQVEQNTLDIVSKSDKVATIDEKTANYTLALTDSNKVINANSAGVITITVPLNSNVAFPIGTQIALFREGTGNVTFAPESTVVINSDGGKLSIKTQYTSAALLKIDTDEWLLVGNLVTL